MKFFGSYKAAYQFCIDNNAVAAAHLRKMSKNMDIDTSDCYKVFYLLTGNKRFHINEKVYEVNAGDLFLLTSMDWHYFSDFAEEESHERIVFFISEHYFKQHTTLCTDLRSCFESSGGKRCCKISLPAREQAHMLRLVGKLRNTSGYGADILDGCYFLELLVFLNQVVAEEVSGSVLSVGVKNGETEQMEDVLKYINKHIAEELTAGVLASRFYVSETCICRRFKKYTGVTLHKYITAQRIALSKRLLVSGASVSEACQQSGFNDYSHFIKVFKKAVGVSPKRFAKSG